MPGKFVTFEGLDGSGKSTHLLRVAGWLRQRVEEVVCTHEPGGTPFGDAIRSVFLDRRSGPIDGVAELLLVAASRRQHLFEVVEPALARGAWVLCDRFSDSTHAYQGFGRGVPLEEIESADALATRGRRPDLTILLDVEAETARSRGQGRQTKSSHEDRLDAEDLAFYERVREGFLSRAEAEPERFRIVDAAGSKEATAEAVCAALAELVETIGEGP